MATRAAAADGTPGAEIPTAAAVLGFAGAIPFAALALASFSTGDLGTFALDALWGYGLAILSFLGGVHWGAAMIQAEPTLARLGASVVPTLAGWVAYLVGGTVGLWLLALAFAGLLAYDLGRVRAGAAPVWYPRLRWPLTLIVATSLLLASIRA